MPQYGYKPEYVRINDPDELRILQEQYTHQQAIKDIGGYVKKHPVQAAWGTTKFAADFLLDLLPGIGDIKGVTEATTGKSLTGELSPMERGLAGVGALPFIPGQIKALGKKSNFEKWFGKSKIVDDYGDPIPLVHHGFNETDVYKRLDKQDKVTRPFRYEYGPLGTWFGQRNPIASASHEGYGPYKIEAYVSLKNPLHKEQDIAKDEFLSLVKEFDGIVPEPFAKGTISTDNPSGVKVTLKEAERLFDSKERVPQWGALISFYSKNHWLPVNRMQKKFKSAAKLRNYVKKEIKERWNVDITNPDEVAYYKHQLQQKPISERYTTSKTDPVNNIGRLSVIWDSVNDLVNLEKKKGKINWNTEGSAYQALDIVGNIRERGKLTNVMERAGYDGYVAGNFNEVVAFKPRQIKSTSNIGTFDESDPSVMRSAIPVPFTVPRQVAPIEED